MTTDGRRQEVLPCLDAHGVEGWSCQTHDGTGLWCANCLANSTSDPEAGLRALEQMRDEMAVEAERSHNSAESRFMARRWHKTLAAYLATRTPQYGFAYPTVNTRVFCAHCECGFDVCPKCGRDEWRVKSKTTSSKGGR